jgi:hypothetical protein
MIDDEILYVGGCQGSNNNGKEKCNEKCCRYPINSSKYNAATNTPYFLGA